MILALNLGVTAILAAVGALLLLVGISGLRPAPRHSVFDDSTGAPLFMFDGDTLIDATPAGRALLAGSTVSGGNWEKLSAHLKPKFPTFERELHDLPTSGAFALISNSDDSQVVQLNAEHRAGLTRIMLTNTKSASGRSGYSALSDPILQRTTMEELGFLRTALAEAPLLAWHENHDREVTWANATYLHCVSKTLPPGRELSWPLPRLFETEVCSQAHKIRKNLRFFDQSFGWFDIHSHADANGHRMYGVPSEQIVLAEQNYRDLLQTLTKTFAHLPVGLAVFDSQRQLQLFNPALLDLTGLQPDFLSMKPSLLTVLDALRERKIIPEPRDYRDWQRNITEMESASASSHFEEIWNLPGDQTYRVIGRPHPNGALALVIEDISTEMSRTRRYKADLELGQCVIDTLEEAIAIFSESGQLVMINTAYCHLWDHDPSERISSGAIAYLARYWQSKSASSALWADAESYIANVGERAPWTGEVRLSDGRQLSCRFTPLSGGSTLVGFTTYPSRDQRLPQRSIRKTA